MDNIGGLQNFVFKPNNHKFLRGMKVSFNRLSYLVNKFELDNGWGREVTRPFRSNLYKIAQRIKKLDGELFRLRLGTPVKQKEDREFHKKMMEDRKNEARERKMMEDRENEAREKKTMGVDPE